MSPNSLMGGFSNLPTPIRLVMVVAAGGGLVGAMAMFGLSGPALVVLIIGVVLVVALLFLYKKILQLFEKRKAEPMSEAISGNAGAAPMGVSEPARRARLDDLRKNFETGVEKFKAAGKNLYSLPWYLLVGEPGSGKTEAIRHCNVGFPPGLQDQLQGAGGTLNMNWWFTNYAIILDTAGRLMFEEVEPGSTSEWQEFLKLLKKSRPNCPVNGMMLVIPADSLIRDSADSIERKGGKIAQQLDAIQRVLGVRFPVFVVVTKCDLINGFREFFDDLTDPTLQHQMLGWSNPADLDTPFNPEHVEEHLKTVQQRLYRRRLGLILDPVNTEDPRARRTDQVDAMYSFPEAFLKIAPRLSRYLQMIFVAGEWSQAPLFLRGIYFTSAMREGSALDADLAEALGMPIESLPEGKVWERERAVFLRDVFLAKVFRERGLVTRARNVRGQQSGRRRMVYGAAVLGAVVLGLFTWLGLGQLNKRVGGPATFWANAPKPFLADDAQEESEWDRRITEGERNAKTGSYKLPIVSLNERSTDGLLYTYRGQDALTFEGVTVPAEHKKLAPFMDEVKHQAETPISVPIVFYPFAAATGDFGSNLAASERREKARILFEDSVLRPIIDAARLKMLGDLDAQPPRWTDEATGAYQQLLRLELAGIDKSDAKKKLALEPLFRYVLDHPRDREPERRFQALDKPENKPILQEIAGLQEVYEWLYADGGGGWPSQSLRGSSEHASLLTRVGSAVADYWSPEGGGGGTPLGDVNRFASLLSEFETAEKALLDIDTQAGDARHDESVKEWKDRYAKLTELVAGEGGDGGLNAALAKLRARTIDGKPMPAALPAAFDAAFAAYREKGMASLQALLGEIAEVAPAEGQTKPELTPENAGGGGQGARVAALAEVYADLNAAQHAVDTATEAAKPRREKMARLEALHMGSAESPLYRKRYEGMYARAAAFLTGSADETGAAGGGGAGVVFTRLGGLHDEREKTRVLIKDAVSEQQGSGPLVADANAIIKRGREVSEFALALGERERASTLVSSFIDAHAQADSASIASEVKAHAESAGLLVRRPAVPMTVSRETLDARYNSAALKAVLGDYMAVAAALNTPAGEPARVRDAAALSRRYDAVRRAAKNYVLDAARYWGAEYADEYAVATGPWKDFADRLSLASRWRDYAGPLDEARAIVEAAARDLREAVGMTDDKEVLDAVAAVSDRAGAAKRTLDERGFRDAASDVMANWQGLGPSSSVAREKLVAAVRQPRGVGDYFLMPQDLGKADFIERFWRNWTLKALTSLADDAGGAAREAFTSLKGLQRFPLSKAGLADPLSEAEYTAALDKAAMLPIASGGGASGADLRIGDKDFDDKLALLMGSRLFSDKERDWIESLQALLSGLPEKGERLRAKVQVIGTTPDRPETAWVRNLVPRVRMVQGSRQLDERALFGAGEPDLGTAEYPGEPITLVFTDDNGNEKARAALPGGSWGVLGAIAAGGSSTRAAGGSGGTGGVVGATEWETDIRVPYAGTDTYLRVRITIDRGVPSVAKWPE